MSRKKTYATFNQRVLAHNIDLVVVLPLFYLLGYFVSNNLLLFSLCFIVYVLYHICFEMSGWRATPGKKSQHISISLDSELSDLSFKSICIRNAAKSISILLFFSGFLWMIFDVKNRTLHDRLAGTVIIINEN